MRSKHLRGIGKCTFTALLAFSLSFMMVPATAFAEIGGNAYKVEVDATDADASHTTGDDVTATDTLAVGVHADNGHTAEAEVGSVTSSYGGQHAVLVEADNGGTATATTGDITQNRGNFGVVASASGGGNATVETGDIALAYNYYAAKNAGVEASASDAGSSVQVSAGNVTGAPRYGNGIDASTMGGSVEVAAKIVKAYEIGLNLDNAPTDAAAAFTGEKRVVVDSVMQTKDSRYSAAGVNAFAYTSGDTSTVQVIGDVSAAGSRGIDAEAVGGGETCVSVGGTVDANYLGVKIVAGSLGNVSGTTPSTGTATVQVGNVISKKWDKAVEIDSNKKGSTVTFQVDGDVKALDSGSTGMFVRSVGGKTAIVVNGDVSGTQSGMVLYTDEIGSNDVLVTGTISGKNGVDISYDSIEKDSLTVWKIDKASNGQYVSSEWVNVPSDDREIFAKKRISYIVKVTGDDIAAEAGLRAARDAAGTELAMSHGYQVAKEGTKVYLIVDPGYTIVSASNANDNQAVLQDADGNYYIVVQRGGGIDLQALVESEGEGFIIVPDPVTIVTEARVNVGTAASAPVATGGNRPLLTYGGVEINEVKLEMKEQTPNLRLKLSNLNNYDVEFDCTKFKVVRADDEKEVAFKTKPQQLKANESFVECEFSADANTLKAGEQARVFYDDKLLGIFTVTEQSR